MTPASAPWLKGVAQHFQHYKINKMSAFYRPRVSATYDGSITIAPYYEAEFPDELVRAIGTNATNIFDFLSSLPGAKQFALWASDTVAAATGSFVRSIFRVVGVDVYGSGVTAGAMTDESRTPGYFMWQAQSSESTANSGDIWLSYDIELIAPANTAPFHASFYSESTDGADLGLTTAARRITGGLCRPVGTNTIEFLTNTDITLVHGVTGTSIVPDVDAIVINDYAGNNVTDNRLYNTFDYSASAAVDCTNPANQDMYGGSGSAKYVQIFAFRAHPGDRVTFPDVTSGTLGRTVINIHEGAHHFPGRA
jgi:hypothetical protein